MLITGRKGRSAGARPVSTKCPRVGGLERVAGRGSRVAGRGEDRRGRGAGAGARGEDGRTVEREPTGEWWRHARLLRVSGSFK